MLIKEKQKVVCAAIRLTGGLIITGARHFDEIMVATLDACEMFQPDAAQGFIDQWGNFLTREQAYEVALRQGQYKPWGNHTPGVLYSEDLY